MPEREPRARLGILSRTYGLAGMVRCAPATAATPRVTTPCDAWIGYSASFVRQVRLQACEAHGDNLLCRIEGVATPEQAALLLDQALFVEWESVSFEDPEADARLIGYRVIDESGSEIGALSAIMRTPAQFVWTVAQGNREWLMPAVPEFVIGYDHQARTVIVRPIPGLFEDFEDDDDATGDARTS